MVTQKFKKREIKIIENGEGQIYIKNEPEYLFLTGIRESFCLIPQWSNWEKAHYGREEYIFNLKVICVDVENNKIEKLNFNIDPSSLTRYHKDGTSMNARIYKLFCTLQSSDRVIETRTREQFMRDYNSVIDQFDEVINYGEEV